MEIQDEDGEIKDVAFFKTTATGAFSYPYPKESVSTPNARYYFTVSVLGAELTQTLSYTVQSNGNTINLVDNTTEVSSFGTIKPIEMSTPSLTRATVNMPGQPSMQVVNVGVPIRSLSAATFPVTYTFIHTDSDLAIKNLVTSQVDVTQEYRYYRGTFRADELGETDRYFVCVKDGDTNLLLTPVIELEFQSTNMQNLVSSIDEEVSDIAAVYSQDFEKMVLSNGATYESIDQWVNSITEDPKMQGILDYLQNNQDAFVNNSENISAFLLIPPELDVSLDSVDSINNQQSAIQTPETLSGAASTIDWTDLSYKQVTSREVLEYSDLDGGNPIYEEGIFKSGFITAYAKITNPTNTEWPAYLLLPGYKYVGDDGSFYMADFQYQEVMIAPGMSETVAIGLLVNEEYLQRVDFLKLLSWTDLSADGPQHPYTPFRQYDKTIPYDNCDNYDLYAPSIELGKPFHGRINFVNDQDLICIEPDFAGTLNIMIESDGNIETVIFNENGEQYTDMNPDNFDVVENADGTINAYYLIVIGDDGVDYTVTIDG